MKIAAKWKGALSDFLGSYKYQPKLTAKLDSLGKDPFDQQAVNEIVLWKVNRFADLSSAALKALNGAVTVKPGEHEHARSLLALLLEQPGVDLPMASTLLRFRNSATFQIIDRHAYRAIYGEDYPLHSGSDAPAKIELYLRYLDELQNLAVARGVPFEVLDRVLYVFDKEKNGKL